MIFKINDQISRHITIKIKILHLSIIKRYLKNYLKMEILFWVMKCIINLKINSANFCSSKFAIGCANGTDALTIALKSLKFKKKLRSYNSCNDILFNSVLLLLTLILKPVLVDIEYMKSTMDINSDLKKKMITKKTKVILCQSIYMGR